MSGSSRRSMQPASTMWNAPLSCPAAQRDHQQRPRRDRHGQQRRRRVLEQPDRRRRVVLLPGPSGCQRGQPGRLVRPPTAARPRQADGHMSVKVERPGEVLAAVKTKGATTTADRRPSPDHGGAWQAMKTVDDSIGSPDPTRPILVIDEENNEADVFMTNQVNGGYHHPSDRPLSTLDFGAPSDGTAFIQSSADPRSAMPRRASRRRRSPPGSSSSPPTGPRRSGATSTAAPARPARPSRSPPSAGPRRPGTRPLDRRVHRRLDRRAGDLGVELRRRDSGRKHRSRARATPTPPPGCSRSA